MTSQMHRKYSNIKELMVKDCEGTEWQMCDLLDNVTLFVNMESSKDWIEHNQEALVALERMYNKFNNKGFEILAFPCDLGRPGKLSAREMKEQLVKRHHITFPVMETVSLTDAPHPLFMLLHRKLEQLREREVLTDKQIGLKWDLSKYLLVEGNPVKQFASTVPFGTIEQEIVFALDKECHSSEQGPCANPYHIHQHQAVNIDGNGDNDHADDALPEIKTTLRKGDDPFYSGHSAFHEQGQYGDLSRDVD